MGQINHNVIQENENVIDFTILQISGNYLLERTHGTYKSLV